MERMRFAACRGQDEIANSLENPVVARKLINDFCSRCVCRRACLESGLELVDLIKAHRLLTVVEEDRHLDPVEAHRQRQKDASLSRLPIVYGGKNAQQLESLWSALSDKQSPYLECSRCGESTHASDYDLKRFSCLDCLTPSADGS